MIKNVSVRHALQSEEWMKFQEDLGKEVVKGSGKEWSVAAVLESGHSRALGSLKRLYAPYGPHVMSKESMKEALCFLKKEAIKKGASYIRIEPTQIFSPSEMESLGCVKAPHDFQPSLTNILDLTKDSDVLITNMDYEMRRLSRQLEKRGFSFSITYDPKNMDEFLKMLRSTEDRSNAVLRGNDYLKKMIASLGPGKTAGVAYASVDGKKISGALFYDDKENKTRYYMHAGSNLEARKLSGNPAIVLFLILNARESGLENFDFYGVSPIGDKTHRWAGFSKFKRDFGGVDMQYTGTWELPVNKLNYKILNLARKLGRAQGP